MIQQTVSFECDSTAIPVGALEQYVEAVLQSGAGVHHLATATVDKGLLRIVADITQTEPAA